MALHRKAVYLLVLAVASLLVLGIVMLFSTGAFAQDAHGDTLYFVKRQALWLVLATGFFFAVAATDYDIWRRTWWLWFSLAALLLVLCFIPPIGQKINGSWRWINLGIGTYQPSEFAKVAAIVFAAWWFSKFESKSSTFLIGFLAPLAIISPILLLIGAEQDLGATALIAAVVISIMFVAGTNLWALGACVAGGIAALGYVILQMPERLGRITAFLDPEAHRLGDAHQQWQALIAFGSGGISGLGLGEGRQKMLYLPYAHSDFIFPMIGEELGLVFSLGVVFMFIMILVMGSLISINARDRFGMLLGFGATICIVLQAAINIGVTTSLLPNKGMPLPFISAGGSNLLTCMLLIGLLVSIHRHGKRRTTPHNRLMVAARMTR